MRVKPFATAAVAALALTAFAACGDDDDDVETPEPDGTAEIIVEDTEMVDTTTATS